MKKTIFWILAIVITLASAYYQRKTGPTRPKSINLQLSQVDIDFQLPRSHVSTANCRVEIPNPDSDITGEIVFKRYPTADDWSRVQLDPQNQQLTGFLPKQPPAGKLKYFIRLWDKDAPEKILSTEEVIIRYKGEVPDWALIPHVLFMFAAMLISNLSGLFALGKMSQQVFYGRLALILLLAGGMVFGPVVQHFAFGQAWTGIPLGWDLTDNKTLLGVIGWIVAVMANRKKNNYKTTIFASVLLLLIYIIPHSMFGSELDYAKGEVVTGMIRGIFWICF
ncbi:MAG: hypothetical protein V2I54_00310 [Bacteroidales bacterium]|jgi:hypothetical protein|nr:hypothetical protein [Bacteroidales bacterium]